MSSFGSLQIARSGLTVNESGLNVTGHNISNVNTPGYVRQQAIIANSRYRTLGGRYEVGMGADIEDIRQIRHAFIDNVYRQESTTLGYYEARSKTFQDVQAILGEPIEQGLQSAMNQFWDSWQELSKAPDSLTVRALVRQRGEALVHHINHMGDQINKLQEDINSEIKVKVQEINQLTEGIAKLNGEIMQAEITGDSANDMRDQRNLMVDKLSRLADVQVNEMQDGNLDISLGGYYLVNRCTSTGLDAVEGSSKGLFCVPVLEGTGIEVPVNGGALKGMLESRGEVFAESGSVENGSPVNKADIVFVVDTSAGSGAAYLDKLKQQVDPPYDTETYIEKYINDLDKRGLDYNLRLVTMGGTAVQAGNFGSDKAGFIAAINNLTETADTENDFSGAVSLLKNMDDFREGAVKHAIFLTHESIGGDENNVDGDAANGLVGDLADAGIKASVVAKKEFYDTGSGSETTGWNSISEPLGGKLHDLESGDFTELMTEINADTNSVINKVTGVAPGTANILPEIRKRLNALVNVLAREVNYLHKSGKTMDLIPEDGQDFFIPADNSRPIEMDNIKLNDIFADLNSIAASSNGNKGDNTIAIKMADLRHQPFMEDANGAINMDEYYQSIILGVGNGGAEAERISDSQNKLVSSSDMLRQSISGVSMDEEMTNMLKYKFAYNASSRVLNAIDEMIETVISRVGLAGR